MIELTTSFFSLESVSVVECSASIELEHFIGKRYSLGKREQLSNTKWNPVPTAFYRARKEESERTDKINST